MTSTPTLDRDAAVYVARHLATNRILPTTDPEGYKLAIRLAITSGPMAAAEVTELLSPLVDLRSPRALLDPVGCWDLLVAYAKEQGWSW